MQPDDSDKRREPRIAIEGGTSVEVFKNGQIIHAATVNMSGCGVLLQLQSPQGLTLGDQVTCEFDISPDPEKPLPCWAVGAIVRLDDCRAAVDFNAGGFIALDSTKPVSATDSGQREAGTTPSPTA
ncbi:MAG: PilZ domain-containing protein [Bryobacteraceae bacterium]